MAPTRPRPRQALAIDFEWDASGAAHYAEKSDLLVIVDALSFSTCVDIVTGRDAAVIPFPSRGDGAAEELAQRIGALCAGPRAAGSYSLSPETLRAIPPGSTLVLPSPNGSRIASLASATVGVAIGCFRNASAVASYIHDRPDLSRVTVIAAGERWRNDALRPAIEDLLGAGAILDRLDGDFSAEARVARAAYQGVRAEIAPLIYESLSGQELAEMGYIQDVSLALEQDISRHVPVFSSGKFRRAL